MLEAMLHSFIQPKEQIQNNGKGKQCPMPIEICAFGIPDSRPAARAEPKKLLVTSNIL
jgi:hypothetical protein